MLSFKPHTLAQHVTMANFYKRQTLCKRVVLWCFPSSLWAFSKLTCVCVRAVHAVSKHFWMASPVFRQVHFMHDGSTMGSTKEHKKKLRQSHRWVWKKEMIPVATTSNFMLSPIKTQLLFLSCTLLKSHHRYCKRLDCDEALFKSPLFLLSFLTSSGKAKTRATWMLMSYPRYLFTLTVHTLQRFLHPDASTTRTPPRAEPIS